MRRPFDISYLRQSIWSANPKKSFTRINALTKMDSLEGYKVFGIDWFLLDAYKLANMMTSSNGNIFRVTGHSCGDLTGHQWIPLTKASDAGLLIFSLICPWINVKVKNGEAGDLRRHRAHYDVIAMPILAFLHITTDIVTIQNCLWIRK